MSSTQNSSLSICFEVESRMYQLYQVHMLASTRDRLMSFLARSNQRGKSHNPERHIFPTLKRLGEYCGCSQAVMSRIASGLKPSIDMGMLEVLEAVACICPATTPDRYHSEIKSRILDADAWLLADEAERPKLIDFLKIGIQKRILDYDGHST